MSIMYLSFIFTFVYANKEKVIDTFEKNKPESLDYSL